MIAYSKDGEAHVWTVWVDDGRRREDVRRYTWNPDDDYIMESLRDRNSWAFSAGTGGTGKIGALHKLSARFVNQPGSRFALLAEFYNSEIRAVESIVREIEAQYEQEERV